MIRPRSLAVALFAFSLGASTLHAGDLRIPLPKKSKYTPVQKLNRDGVAAVQKHEYDKAKKLFYKAYLVDPNDPFTLNNLGYLAELEGDTDRAQRFYQLSSEQNSDAVVDKASNDLYEGKPVSAVAGNAEEKGIKVNRLNSQAITLLSKDRAPEADLILQKALTIDSRNPFTLNNLGYAKEKEGELESAYQFYNAAASTRSRERIEISADKDWRGREISSVASDNAKKLRKRMREDSVESRVAILNLRGVSAMNRNDRRAARDFIQQAYKLAPADAFTLNNMGYLAEMDGDRETADYYYDRARDANQKGARITLATRKELEGKRIGEVAEQTDNLVLSKIEQERIARQQQGGPVMLHRRDNTAVVEPNEPVARPTPVRVSDANGNLILPPLPKMSPVPSTSSRPVTPQNPSEGGGLMMPLPDNQQPTTVHEGERDGGMIMPLPDDQQPGSQPQTGPVQPQQQNPNIKQGEVDNGVMMPLPDDQQPGTQPQSAPTQPPVQQGPTDNGVMMPLPDNQQPGARQAQPQPTPAPSQQNAPVAQKPPLLLPPPDSQQPGAAQPQTTAPPTQPQTAPAATPQNNTGVYAPPPVAPATVPATSTTNTYKPASPKKINDNAPSTSNTKKPTTTNDSSVKKISDQ
jgi:Flp pilus assembly protein TadD